MYIPLHSTMFLLIQGSCKSSKDFFISFTFHNVSINTSGAWQLAELGLNFTFHNVSINTNLPQSLTLILACFTFHNVSINTFPPDPPRWG